MDEVSFFFFFFQQLSEKFLTGRGVLDWAVTLFDYLSPLLDSRPFAFTLARWTSNIPIWFLGFEEQYVGRESIAERASMRDIGHTISIIRGVDLV